MIGKVGKCCQMWGISWGVGKRAGWMGEVLNLSTKRARNPPCRAPDLLIVKGLQEKGGTLMSRLGASGSKKWRLRPAISRSWLMLEWGRHPAAPQFSRGKGGLEGGISSKLLNIKGKKMKCWGNGW